MLPYESELRHVGVNYVKQTFACLWAGKKIDYLATPISTGMRYIEWYKREGYQLLDDKSKFKAAHYANVVEPNVHAAQMTKLQLDEPGRGIYCPVELHFPEWSHGDYMEICNFIIERNISRLYFMQGWQASIGCVLEFCQAIERQLPCFRHDRSELDYRQSLQIIKQTVPLLAGANLPVEPFNRVIGRLEWLLD